MTQVLKFGGTSVQDAPAIRRLIEIVKSRSGNRWVVVSALARVTDALVEIGEQAARGNTPLKEIDALEQRHLDLAQELLIKNEAVLDEVRNSFKDLRELVQSLTSIGEVSDRSRDRILSIGELCSSGLVAAAFQTAGVPAEWVDPRQVMKTDSGFTHAQVDFAETARATVSASQSAFSHAEVVITGGFVGSDSKGIVTTLGRGGSDYSAAVFGSVLNSSVIEIWTDVDGILTTDPRLVPSARKILKLSFDEAAELAYFGAKVLHPATILPAVQKNIPVYVLNSRNPGNSGTRIYQETDQEIQADRGVIKAIAFKRDVTLINIYSTRMLGAAGFLKSVFEAFARHKVSIDLISTSEVNVSLTVDRATDADALNRVVSELEGFSKITIEKKRASIATVGKGIRQAAGVAAQIFGALKGIRVFMISMGSSEVNLSLVVAEEDLTLAVSRLHEEFFSNDLPEEVFEKARS